MLSESANNLLRALSARYPDLRRVAGVERDAVRHARAALEEAARALAVLEAWQPDDMEHRAKFLPGAFRLTGTPDADQVVKMVLYARIVGDGRLKAIEGQLVPWNFPDDLINVRLSRRREARA